MASNTVLVMGATGNVGRPLVDELLKKGVAVRAVTRDPSKFDHLKSKGVQTVKFDLSDPQSVEAALQGVQKVFFLSSFASYANSVEEAKKTIEFFKKSKDLKLIVRLSAYKVDQPNFLLGAIHVQIEDLVKSSGIPYVILRPNSFHQNIGNFFGAAISGGSDIYSAFGTEKLSYVDTRDIAAVAAEFLSRDDLGVNKTVNVSGPVAINHDEIADTLSRHLGRQVKYINIPDEAYRSAMKGFGFDDNTIDILLDLYKEYQAGRHISTDDEAEKILGRKLISFDQYVADNVNSFGGKKN